MQRFYRLRAFYEVVNIYKKKPERESKMLPSLT